MVQLKENVRMVVEAPKKCQTWDEMGKPGFCEEGVCFRQLLGSGSRPEERLEATSYDQL